MAAYNTNHGDQYRFQYLVYSENYHVCLLIATRTNQSGEDEPQQTGITTINLCLPLFYCYIPPTCNIMHCSLVFMVNNKPSKPTPRVEPEDKGGYC